MISRNAHRYPISALCRCLGITRSLYYYHLNQNQKKKDEELGKEIKEVFEQNRRVYGCRKIKALLQRKGKRVSKRRICRIMKDQGLRALLGKKRPTRVKSKPNEAETPNILDRRFDDQEQYAAVVSDLTYVRVGSKWNYMCILLDLHNREIIGYSVGTQKDAKLVYEAFASVSIPLNRLQLFHTDRGNEFDNRLIDEMLQTFQIQRSLSKKACPYDNAVAEATFKLIKAEFVNHYKFENLGQLRIMSRDYIHWFNNIRIHSSLGYLSPVEFRKPFDVTESK